MTELIKALDAERPARPETAYDIGYNNGLTMAIAIAMKPEHTRKEHESMKMIELHHDEDRISLRVDCIVAVSENRHGIYTEVYTVGDNNPWNVDETYKEVIQMIREVSNETG